MAKEPKWLVMVHMTADAPNLEEPLRLDTEELSRTLREIGPKYKERVRVMLQVDTASAVSKRFELTHSDPTWLKTFPKRKDSIDEFVDSATGEIKTDKTALVLWGHSTGVGHGVESPLPGSPPPPELHVGLDIPRGLVGSKKKVDILGFDACYMASAELAYQVRNNAAYLLAPQAGIGMAGWHYDQLLDRIVAEPGIEPEALGVAVIQQVGLSLSSPQQLSLINLGHIGDLAAPLKALVGALAAAEKALNREPQLRSWVMEAFNEAAWAGLRQFLDLADLCRILASRIPVAEVRRTALKMIEVLVRTNANRVIADQLSVLDIPLGGLSLFCPWPRATAPARKAGARNVQVDPGEYTNLKLSKDTGWDKYIFDAYRVRQAERRWVQNEVRDAVEDLRYEYEWEESGGQALGPKPPGKGPKPPGKGPKPPGRGSDHPTSGRGDPWDV